MPTIAEFLTARLDEDERIADLIRPGGYQPPRWTTEPTGNGSGRWTCLVALETSMGAPDTEAPERGIIGYISTGRSEHAHIARHDPARVLAEVAAKRALIAYAAPPREPETDEQLHARHAHPAYEYATTEGQRKAWDRADEPPEGDGWERNVDAGRDGWDRFDYTEESYWRRLLPDGPPPPYVPMILRIMAAIYATHPDYDPTWSLDAPR